MNTLEAIHQHAARLSPEQQQALWEFLLLLESRPAPAEPSNESEQPQFHVWKVDKPLIVSRNELHER